MFAEYICFNLFYVANLNLFWCRFVDTVSKYLSLGLQNVCNTVLILTHAYTKKPCEKGLTQKNAHVQYYILRVTREIVHTASATLIIHGKCI